jgi:hypothetical protein
MSCIQKISNGSFDSLKTDSFSASSFLRLAVSSSAVQRIEGERYLRTDAGDLRPARVPANQVSKKCARTTAHALPSSCSSSIHARDSLLVDLLPAHDTMVILWIDLLSICLIYIVFCDLILICVVLVLFMLTANRSFFFYIFT